MIDCRDFPGEMQALSPTKSLRSPALPVERQQLTLLDDLHEGFALPAARPPKPPTGAASVCL